MIELPRISLVTFLVLNLHIIVIVHLSARDTVDLSVTYVMVKLSLYKFCLFGEDDVFN